ncbi:MAG: D-2-hydroxyacid dehydrogenase [Parasporobacterium sp.]|nr:D-2-hydroxyacid dehydrogenase [Parasporobacterium sp.]
MKISVLDTNTLTYGDLDFAPIEACGEVSFYDLLPAEEVVNACKGAEVVLVNKTLMTPDIMNQLPDLKYIGLFATGYNNIDLTAARERGIDVVNVPGYSTDSVAQLVFAFILSHATNIASYNESVHKGDWINSPSFAYFPLPIEELAGKNMGIVGFGNLGKKVAKIADALGMKVMIHSRRIYEDCPYRQVGREELFREADYLSINCPLNEQTANIVCEETLRMMKKNAFLVNTARGGCVDSKALKKALDEGWISGAGIDVLVFEPMSADEPLFTAKNCMITPHIGWASIEARRRLIDKVAENITAWQQGRPQNVVND